MITDPNTGEPTVFIVRQLETMYGSYKLPVPGCEPTTSLTSTVAEQQIGKLCKNTVVDLHEVVKAIPDASIRVGVNFGSIQARYLVLPPWAQNCCVPQCDWFKVLKLLSADQHNDPYVPADTVRYERDRKRERANGFSGCAISERECFPYVPEGSPLEGEFTP